MDYTTDTGNIWIPLTPYTEKNAIQVITLPSNTPEDVLEQVASYVDEVDFDALAHGVDYLILQLIVAKPMSILYMRRGTIHRGVPSTAEDHRVMFYISVHFIKDYDNNYPYDSDSMRASESSVEEFGE